MDAQVRGGGKGVYGFDFELLRRLSTLRNDDGLSLLGHVDDPALGAELSQRTSAVAGDSTNHAKMRVIGEEITELGRHRAQS